MRQKGPLVPRSTDEEDLIEFVRETRSRADRILANAQELQGISSGDESANSNNDSLVEEGDDT